MGLRLAACWGWADITLVSFSRSKRKSWLSTARVDLAPSLPPFVKFIGQQAPSENFGLGKKYFHEAATHLGNRPSRNPNHQGDGFTGNDVSGSYLCDRADVQGNLYTFMGDPQGGEGYPHAGLTIDRAGNLYGTTSGAASYGSVFEMVKQGNSLQIKGMRCRSGMAREHVIL